MQAKQEISRNHADEGLEKLRKSFEPLIPTYIKKLDRAEIMSFHRLEADEKISIAQCHEIEKKIIPKYRINPIYVVTDEGVSHGDICRDDDRLNTWIHYFKKQKGKTNFDLDYDYIVSFVRGPEGWEYHHNVYLDSTFHIIEINSYFITDNQPWNVRVNSLDRNGDRYQRFLGGDGTSVWYTDVSGTYDGKLFGRPNRTSELTIKYRDGVEYCMWGSVQSEAGNILFPANQDVRDKCKIYE